MILPTTKPNDRDIAWYIRECEDLRKRLESLAESDKKQTDDYVCVDREHALYKRAPRARDAVSADRLALAISLETIDQLERENAALRADAERYRWIKRDNIGVHDVLELFMSYINCDLDKEIDQTRAKEGQP